MAKTDLTADRLRELLHYDPETGIFIARVDRPLGRIKAGQPVGYLHKGYQVMKIACVRHKAHRLAWLYVTGDWPTESIDHRDGDKLNNRFSNLRDVSHSINMQNRPGDKGYWKTRSGWAAQVMTNGVKVSKSFLKEEEAAAWRIATKAALHASAF